MRVDGLLSLSSFVRLSGRSAGQRLLWGGLIAGAGCFGPASEDDDAADTVVEPSSSAGIPEPDEDGSDDRPESSSGFEPQTCETDRDCLNEDPCQPQACADGVCEAADPPCPTPDADHCEGQCEADGDQAVCTVVARDADADGEGDMRCREAPGTDCNDGDPSIGLNAAEVCDEVDNNCNDDVDEGLSLADSTLEIANVDSAIDITWSPRHRTYGLVWRQTVPPPQSAIYAVHFASFNGLASDVEVHDVAAAYTERPRIEAGGDYFGVMFESVGSGIYLRRTLPDGAMHPLGLVDETSEHYFLDAAPRPDGGWLVAWSFGGATASTPAGIKVRTLQTNGMGHGSVRTLQPAEATSRRWGDDVVVAAGADTYAFVWEEQLTVAPKNPQLPERIEEVVSMGIYDDELSSPVTAVISEVGKPAASPRITALASGYVAAWDLFGLQHSVEYTERTAAGQEVCSVTVSDDDQPRLLDIAAHDARVGVLLRRTAGDGPHSVDFFLFGPQCERITGPVRLGRVADNSSLGGALAGGEHGWVAGWQHNEGGVGQMTLSAFGRRVCEPHGPRR